MTKKKRYTLRFLLRLTTLPFLIVVYFFKKMLWSYVTKKKPFIEWVVLILSIAIVVLVISGIFRGDFKPGKDSQDQLSKSKQPKKH